MRELENLIRRICALYGEDLITAPIPSSAEALADQQPAARGEEGPVDRSLLAGRAQALRSYFADQLRRPAAGRAFTIGCLKRWSGR